MDYSELRIFHAFLLTAYDMGMTPEVVDFCKNLPASIAAVHDRELAEEKPEGDLAWKIHQWLMEEGQWT